MNYGKNEVEKTLCKQDKDQDDLCEKKYQM